MTAPKFTIQVYGDDAGGIDEDFYAETLEEARAVAEKYHVPGSRPTEIYDEDHFIVDYYERSE